MAYADQQMSGNRVIAIIIVALIHIALGYALVTGLAYEAATKVLERVTTIDVEEPPPPEEEPPPPPEDVPETAPPPVAPPPPLNISPRPPDIRTQVTIPPPAPPAIRIAPPAPVTPPAPPAPPAVDKSRGAKVKGNWAARIQGDYPSSALRREEQGTVGMRITVGADGRVEACSVTSSSGSSALDEAACRGMQRYARYDPALNSAGNAVSTTMSQSIRYVLPD